MVSPEIGCVVGIDVAKRAHVVCALDAATGSVRQRPTSIEATSEGYAQLIAWLRAWGEPPTLLVGVEATGSLWEPLYDALVLAGYTVVVLNPRQTAMWAASLGLRAKTDGLDAHTLARGLLAGYARGSTVPSETVQALRALTRARRDLVVSQRAARQRLQDELVLVFPELPHAHPGRLRSRYAGVAPAAKYRQFGARVGHAASPWPDAFTGGVQCWPLGQVARRSAAYPWRVTRGGQYPGRHGPRRGGAHARVALAGSAAAHR
jgi:transposase